MGWKQLQPFDLARMGTTPGMCLGNVRKAFGIPPKYADAKSAMLANKQAGTLHPLSEIPNDVAVPVFLDTTSPYEHVVVSDHGIIYSDGRRWNSIAGYSQFGWGETLNGVRIVEWVNEPAPSPSKSIDDLAMEVIRGEWGNGEERRRRLTEAGYDYSAVQQRVNEIMAGTTPTPAPIAVGDKVTLLNWVDYTGTPLRQTRPEYFVSELSGDRAVLRADSMSGPVYAAVNTKDLRKV